LLTIPGWTGVGVEDAGLVLVAIVLNVEDMGGLKLIVRTHTL
jgi:hypothetical protein